MADVTRAQGDRTKVLWLTKGLGPGGAERLLLSFAQNADHDRFELYAAYLLPWKDHLVGDLERAGVGTVCLGSTRPWDLRWLWRLRRLITEQRIGVVHMHSPLVAAQARLVLRTVPRRRRPLSITTEHNVWDSHRGLTRMLNAATLGLDDHVFAVSEQVRESMSPRIRLRVEVLIHGVDVEAIAARRSERGHARAAHGLADDNLVVITVANLRANKDYPTLLRAARQLVEGGVPVTFLAVGQGPLEAELAAMKDDLGLGDCFRFIGYQTDPIAVLAAGDVFCLSSQYEGLPIAMLEAMAMGLPIVSTDVGGISSVIADGVHGHLVPAGDPTALARAISSTQELETRRRLAEAVATQSKDFSILHAVIRQQERYISCDVFDHEADRSRRAAAQNDVP